MKNYTPICKNLFTKIVNNPECFQQLFILLNSFCCCFYFSAKLRSSHQPQRTNHMETKKNVFFQKMIPNRKEIITNILIEPTPFQVTRAISNLYSIEIHTGLIYTFVRQTNISLFRFYHLPAMRTIIQNAFQRRYYGSLLFPDMAASK